MSVYLKKHRKLVLVIAAAAILAVAFVCWARVPAASTLPKGEWANFRAAAFVVKDGRWVSDWVEDVKAEDVKAILEQADVWQLDLRRRAPGVIFIQDQYMFEFTAEGREWRIFVKESGDLSVGEIGYEEFEGFWRMEGPPLTAIDLEEPTQPDGLSGEHRIYWDGGDRYQKLWEIIGDGGLDLPED